MNLKHVFTKKEIALILVLSLVLIGLSYYRFIYLRIGDQIEQYSTSDLKDEIQIEQAKALKKKNMQEEIDTAKSDGSKSELVTYDNKNNEYNLLNDIFELALGTSISFEQPYATGNTVRRNVNVSFTTIDYAAALVIISQLYDSEYRVIIRDINISTGSYTSEYLRSLIAQKISTKTHTDIYSTVQAVMETMLEIGLELLESDLAFLIIDNEIYADLTSKMRSDMVTVYEICLEQLEDSDALQNSDTFESTVLYDMAQAALEAILGVMLDEFDQALEVKINNTETSTEIYSDAQAELSSILESQLDLFEQELAIGTETDYSADSDDGSTIVSNGEEYSEIVSGTEAGNSMSESTGESSSESAATEENNNAIDALLSETESETALKSKIMENIQTFDNCLVNVSLSMTFYETIYGLDTDDLDGLIINDSE